MAVGKCIRFICCYEEKGICKIYKKSCFKCPNSFIDSCDECMNFSACCDNPVGNIEFIEKE